MPFTSRRPQTQAQWRRRNQQIELYGENEVYISATQDFRRCRDALAYFQERAREEGTRFPVKAIMRTSITVTPRQLKQHEEQKRRQEEQERERRERDARMAREREEVIAYISERQETYERNHLSTISELLRQLRDAERHPNEPVYAETMSQMRNRYRETLDGYWVR
jgi:hypothetical protein